MLCALIPDGIGYTHCKNLPRTMNREWTTHVGVWKHYNTSALEKQPVQPTPWTSGMLAKNLRLSESEDSFDLWSVLEHSAVGLFQGGNLAARPVDRHRDLRHTFTQKPWRMGRLRSMLPRASYPGTWPDEADVCRVTIVRPDACTFSGVPYIPPLTLAQHTAADEKESNITAPHPVFYEMWLSENFGDEKEAIKLGLFLCYDGVSGDLQQCFHMKELALLDAEQKIQDPAAEIDFETLSAAVASIEAESRKHLASSQAQQVLGGASVEGIVRKAELRGDVCVHHFVEGALGPEVCWQAQPVAARDFATPSRHQSHAYHHLVFDDGFYAHVPKDLGAFEGDISLEIGCLRMHTSGGGLQRLVVLGDRSRGGFHTLSHEVWN